MFIVYVIEYGAWNYRKISNLTTEELITFNKYYEKLTRYVIRDGHSNNEQGVVLICNYDGFALKHFASSEGKSGGFVIKASQITLRKM